MLYSVHSLSTHFRYSGRCSKISLYASKWHDLRCDGDLECFNKSSGYRTIWGAFSIFNHLQIWKAHQQILGGLDAAGGLHVEVQALFGAQRIPPLCAGQKHKEASRTPHALSSYLNAVL